MATYNFRHLTEEEVKKLLGTNLENTTDWLSLISSFLPLSLYVNSMCSNPPATSEDGSIGVPGVSEIANLLAFTLALIETGAASISLILDILSFYLQLIDRAEDYKERRENNPNNEECGLKWNRIIGKAMNYGIDEQKDYVVKYIPDSLPLADDWHYDFRYMFGFKTSPSPGVQLYLSKEFKYLLGVNLGGAIQE